MIFSRRKPAIVPGLEDQVDDIAQGLAAKEQPLARSPRPATGPRADTRMADGAFGGMYGSLVGREDNMMVRKQDAEREAKDSAVERARREARGKMAESAKNNAREQADGIDYNGDGVIGDPSVGRGREMTTEDLVNTRINEILREDVDTSARGSYDEALRQATAEARLGARARGGIAGMGLTGAAAAMEGAEGRRGERERVMALDAFDRAARAEELQRLQVGARERRSELAEGREAEVYDRILALLDEELGRQPEAPAGEGGGGGGPLDAVLDALEQDSSTPARTGIGGTPGEHGGNPIIVTSPPRGAEMVNATASFGGELYLGEDGKYYGVKTEGAQPQQTSSGYEAVPRSSLPPDAQRNDSASRSEGKEIYYSPSTRRFYEVID